MRAIAADLVRRGHDVTVTTGSQFRSAARRIGARFVPLQGAADFNVDDEENNFPEIRTSRRARNGWASACGTGSSG